MNDILIAREERVQRLNELMVDDYVYLIIKANIPGSNKKIFYSYFLTKFFKKLITNNYKVRACHYFDSADGPYYIIKIDSTDLNHVKKEMIYLEEHPLGRFIDIDVFKKSLSSISRKDLNLSPRKCYLCDNDAFICNRTGKHSLAEIFSFIETTIVNYLSDDFHQIIFDSITLEAKLHPKFGLVTEKSCGSHPDMDFSLLEKARDAICDNLKEMVFLGYTYDLDTAFKESKKMGIVAEEKMLKSTNGINCYKGLIYVLGLTCVSCGYVIKHNLTKDKIFELIAEMTKDAFLDFDNGEETFGKKAFKQYGLKGVRGEAYNGLPAVQKALEVLNGYESLTDEALTMTLINIVGNIEDTVLLKRAGSLEKYHYFKNLISSIKTYDLELIERITEEAIGDNISIGGAADLLVVTIFIKKVLNRYLD